MRASFVLTLSTRSSPPRSVLIPTPNRKRRRKTRTEKNFVGKSPRDPSRQPLIDRTHLLRRPSLFRLELPSASPPLSLLRCLSFSLPLPLGARPSLLPPSFSVRSYPPFRPNPHPPVPCSADPSLEGRRDGARAWDGAPVVCYDFVSPRRALSSLIDTIVLVLSLSLSFVYFSVIVRARVRVRDRVGGVATVLPHPQVFYFPGCLKFECRRPRALTSNIR